MLPHEIIVTLQKDHGLQITEIAERVRVSRTAVYNWQNLRTRPRPHTARALKDILDQYKAKPQVDISTSFLAIMANAKEILAKELGLDPAAIAILIKR